MDYKIKVISVALLDEFHISPGHQVVFNLLHFHMPVGKSSVVYMHLYIVPLWHCGFINL